MVPKEKPSGGDYRCAALRLLAHLKGRANRNIVLLVESIVEITELLYANDDKRNNVKIIRLHHLITGVWCNCQSGVLLQSREYGDRPLKVKDTCTMDECVTEYCRIESIRYMHRQPAVVVNIVPPQKIGATVVHLLWHSDRGTLFTGE